MEGTIFHKHSELFRCHGRWKLTGDYRQSGPQARPSAAHNTEENSYCDLLVPQKELAPIRKDELQNIIKFHGILVIFSSVCFLMIILYLAHCCEALLDTYFTKSLFI